jgi:hypothetical protein
LVSRPKIREKKKKKLEMACFEELDFFTGGAGGFSWSLAGLSGGLSGFNDYVSEPYGYNQKFGQTKINVRES